MARATRPETTGEPGAQPVDPGPDGAGEPPDQGPSDVDLTTLTDPEHTDEATERAVGRDTIESRVQSESGNSQPGRPRRRLARRLVRVTLLAIVLGAIGFGIYLAWPVVYDRYIQPVRDNTAALALVDQRIAAAELRLSELETRAAAIEGVGESLTAIQVGADTRINSIEGLIEAHTTQLDMLDETIGRLEEADEAAAESILSELGIVRSMELLSRARLFLYQANYGLAAQDLTAARNVLASLAPQEEADQALVDSTLFRIDLALAALPDRPVAASDDLDIAWQLLLGEVPAPTPTTTPATATTTTLPPTATTAP